MMLHLHREINELKKKIVLEATLVEDNLREGMKALITRDINLAKRIIKRDKDIDAKEVEIEEDCLKIFALYQPVAKDLRYLVAFLKLNNDLERIGDLASNIAARAKSLAKKEALEIPVEIPKMAEIVQKMLKDTIDALVDLDGAKATRVLDTDDKVDEMNSTMYAIVGEKIQKNPELVDSWMQILGISRYLERIADHCTNICEDLEYMLSGRIQRHPSLGR
ncbi:MAG: phosphate signaling complex protein PhoU [Candidatus Marinimicrobia bacterium]|nr:phosphate signaling complex protein PhoU [Candidatus Neomarinimicrobiota bacterium]